MSEVVHFRTTKENKKVIYDIAKEYGVGMGNLLLDCFFEQHRNTKLQKKYKMEFNKAHKKRKFEESLSSRRESNHYLYLPKNTMKTIIDMSAASLIIAGRINWKVVDMLIKDSEKIFKCLPMKIRKAIEPEMKEIFFLTEEKVISMVNIDKYKIKLLGWKDRGKE